MSNWFLIHTKPRQEEKAFENLKNQGFDCFYPKILQEHNLKTQLSLKLAPLFPSYLFIQLDTTLRGQSWQPIKSTIGVNRLVTFGAQMPKISEDLIYTLKNYSQHENQAKDYFTQGEKVLVTSGPFKGIEAVFQMKDGQDRVFVLIDILSKSSRLRIEPSLLKKLN